MTKSRGINHPKHKWTEDQLAILVSKYPNTKTEALAEQLGVRVELVYRKATALKLRKSASFLAGPDSGRLRQGIGKGKATRFQPGITPWNKGTNFVAGGRSSETRFKPGSSPHNTLPVGSYRIEPGTGTLQRKISEAKGNNSKRWRGVHELMWIEANGLVPKKHIVVFKPGMRTNVLEEITIDKVECISLAENMRRNTRHNYPKEINEVIQMRAVLTRHINKRRKSHEQPENDR